MIDRSKARVLAFSNIVGHGMGGGEIEQNTADMDPKATADMVMRNKDVLVGIKTAHFHSNDPAKEWATVDRAVEAGTIANVPVMIDIGARFRPGFFQEMMLKHLRPGDIPTHAYLGAVPMLDDRGKALRYLFAAKEREIIFDAGHGGGSFLFRQAAPAIRQGFIVDSISIDLHITSMNSGMEDMLNLMSKYLKTWVCRWRM